MIKVSSATGITLQRSIYVGSLAKLISDAPLFGELLCLFTHQPTVFKLQEGTHEHAYYSILTLMAEHCVHFTNIILQLSNNSKTLTLDFNCVLNEDQQTVDHHTRVLTHLLMFPQNELSAVQVNLRGYSVV